MTEERRLLMAQKLADFAHKYMGKVVRDGQCVALFRQYAEECFGIPHTGSVEGAIDLWRTRDSNPKLGQHFEFVYEPENLVPGDVVIFYNTSSNKYGHVALVEELHPDGMSVIEQDGFRLNGVKPAFWTFTRFAGALRPKAA